MLKVNGTAHGQMKSTKSRRMNEMARVNRAVTQVSVKG